MSRRRARRRAAQLSPYDNVVVTHWWQSPWETRLRTDPDPSQISWPFGDDVADVFSSLDDAHFEAYCVRIKRLIEDEAARMPAARRRAFLHQQRLRIEGYRREQRHRKSA